MAESYQPLFDNAEFIAGKPSPAAVDLFEQLAGGWREGNDRLEQLVPTFIQIRKEIDHPWHESILADVVLRNVQEGSQRRLGLLVMERSFIHDCHSSDADKNNTSSDPPQTAAETAPANTEGSTTTTAFARAATDPAAVATTDNCTSTHSYSSLSVTGGSTTPADESARKKDSFWKSGSMSDVASQSSYYLAHSSQAISTPAHDTIKFLPMSAMDTINKKTLPVLEMQLKNTNGEALAAIPDFAILHLLILTHEYTKIHLHYTVLDHQCYHYAVHAFRCAQLLLNAKGIYQEHVFDYKSTPKRSHIRRGCYKLGATLVFTKDPGLADSTVRKLVDLTKEQVKVQLKTWKARGNIRDERIKRQEAEAAAEAARVTADAAQLDAEEARRAAEEERKQAERAIEEERKQKEEAMRAAEEERKKREALEQHLAHLMARFASNGMDMS